MMRGLLVLIVCGCGASELSASVTKAALEDRDLTLGVHYRDGDGNLGGGEAEVQDCRGAELVTKLALPRIASDEAVKAGVAIEGELDLHVYAIGDVEHPV